MQHAVTFQELHGNKTVSLLILRCCFHMRVQSCSTKAPFGCYIMASSMSAVHAIKALNVTLNVCILIAHDMNHAVLK